MTKEYRSAEIQQCATQAAIETEKDMFDILNRRSLKKQDHIMGGMMKMLDALGLDAVPVIFIYGYEAIRKKYLETHSDQENPEILTKEPKDHEQKDNSNESNENPIRCSSSGDQDDSREHDTPGSDRELPGAGPTDAESPEDGQALDRPGGTPRGMEASRQGDQASA